MKKPEPKKETPIKVVKDQENPEPTVIIAKSIIDISNAAQELLNSGLSRRAIVVLLRDAIGVSKIKPKEIEAVLDNLPRLKAIYCQ